MATRQNPHQMNAAAILAECDRTERNASTSSERARRESDASQREIAASFEVITTYEEAQAHFDNAMEERLDIELQIEENERLLAAAIA